MRLIPPVSSVDGVASILSAILATLATLRAGSRLDRRVSNGGSIGLMDGPPILGPRLDRSGTNTTADAAAGCSVVDASPLWEHTEAFRRAVLLGLTMPEDDGGGRSLFSHVSRSEVRHSAGIGCDDEGASLAAAAVESGLIIPSARGGSSVVGRSASKSSMRLQRNGKDSATPSSSENLMVEMCKWLRREMSAPFEALPALYGILSSCLRSGGRDENADEIDDVLCLLTPWERIRHALLGRRAEKTYDSSGMDFHTTLSAACRVPCGSSGDIGETRTARLRSFAPETFRDLRAKCFGVSDREYAESILNIWSDEISRSDTILCLNDQDLAVQEVIREVMSGRRRPDRRRKGKDTSLPYISFQSNSKGAARVGTFFFFTSDGAFMVKTVKREEARAFLDMLPAYHRFMSDGVNGRNSLLTRIFGMYSVRFPTESSAHHAPSSFDERWDGGLYTPDRDSSHIADDERIYLVMHSVFPPEASRFVTRRYDLKGSTAGRRCSMEERQKKGANAVLKDLDLQDEVKLERSLDQKEDGRRRRRTAKDRFGISIGRPRKSRLMAQLRRDVDLLRKCNVLDYSLLVGVADTENKQPQDDELPQSAGLFRPIKTLFRWIDSPLPYFGAARTRVDGGPLSCMPGTMRGREVIYYLGVIDFLQPWTAAKMLERDLKGLAGMDRAAISCAAPGDYADRFLGFVNSNVT
mmetsp:Transcript_11652/g.27384  ORF Transcript_11652/g.27384 Transcript_11652/m.27384 type:complete len:696 (+) Transcript_11652:410-2497(+)